MTVMGHHTGAELDDLINGRDHAHRGLSMAYEAFRGPWAQADAPSFAAFSDAYEANAHKYAEARTQAAAKAQQAYASSLPMNVYPVEDEYVALLAADRRVENTISDGDFDDLYRRITEFGNAAGLKLPDAGPTPQPGKNSDLGLAFLRETEPARVAKETEDAARAAGRAAGGLVGAVLGGTADGVSKNLSTTQMLGGAAAVGVVGLLALSLIPRPFR